MLLERDRADLAFHTRAVRNVAKYSPPVFAKRPDQRHDWQIFLELWSRMEVSRKRGWLGRGLATGARAIAGALGPRAVVGPGQCQMSCLAGQAHADATRLRVPAHVGE